MEAIRAANFLAAHDPNGGEWIRFAKVLEAVESGMSFAEASQSQSQAASGPPRRPPRPRLIAQAVTRVLTMPRRRSGHD